MASGGSASGQDARKETRKEPRRDMRQERRQDNRQETAPAYAFEPPRGPADARTPQPSYAPEFDQQSARGNSAAAALQGGWAQGGSNRSAQASRATGYL